MDLRNYGVIDFAEHVVLPTGDDDDFDNENIGGVTDVFRKGTKQAIIDDLKQTNTQITDMLIERSAQLAELKAQLENQKTVFTEQYSQLVKTAADRDEKETENRDLKAQIKSLKASNQELFAIKFHQGSKKNKMMKILNGKTSKESQEKIEKKILDAYNAWNAEITHEINETKTKQRDRMQLYLNKHKKLILQYMHETQIARDMQAELRKELANL